MNFIYNLQVKHLFITVLTFFCHFRTIYNHNKKFTTWKIFVQSSWDKFLEEIDAKVSKKSSEAVLVPGDPFPSGIQVVNARTNEALQLTSELFFSGQHHQCIAVLLRHFAWLPWRKHVKELEDVKVETVLKLKINFDISIELLPVIFNIVFTFYTNLYC